MRRARQLVGMRKEKMRRKMTTRMIMWRGTSRSTRKMTRTKKRTMR